MPAGTLNTVFSITDLRHRAATRPRLTVTSIIPCAVEKKTGPYRYPKRCVSWSTVYVQYIPCIFHHISACRRSLTVKPPLN